MEFVHRVFSDDLNPEKRWYAVNSYLVDGKEINKLKSSLLFTEFPEELRKVDRLRLKDSNGGLAPKAWFSKSKGNDVFVASSGGLFCYLLRNLNSKSSTFTKIISSESLCVLSNGCLDLENYVFLDDGSFRLAPMTTSPNSSDANGNYWTSTSLLSSPSPNSSCSSCPSHNIYLLQCISGNWKRKSFS